MVGNDPRFALPAGLPEPIDDGAAAHLIGMRLPRLALPSTLGGVIDLSTLDRTVVFAFPRTGVPDKSPGELWDAIPGARGCTPQTCGYRDLAAEFAAVGAGVLGLSTQTAAFQREMAGRLGLGFGVLSDAELALTRALRLPTFAYDIGPIGGGGPDTLLKRMSWWVRGGVIRKVWYPVFPPDRNAGDVLAWLRAGGPDA